MPSIYGPLEPFIENENITDINWNGKQLWIDHLKKGRYMEKVRLDEDFIQRFSMYVANQVNASFNKYHPLLEAEDSGLRVSIIHEDVAKTGRSISIRKSPMKRRLTKKQMMKEGYCEERLESFMKACILAKCNIVITGLPGVGKTEYLKLLTQYIPAKERVITIEDNLEIHYHAINPQKDCVELKVDKDFSYVQAIKASLRQLPVWIILSEARSYEVKYLLESMSTGTHCLTTLHSDDVRKIPDRIKNMMSEEKKTIDHTIYSFIDVGVGISKREEHGKIKRRIDQVILFEHNAKGENREQLIYDDGQWISQELLEDIQRKFQRAHIKDPFHL